ncbi:MAG: hypothetical protein NNA18_11995 [Nitrospira sp.]|nr:hypothetical protein [Nitrospira sp.]
MKKIVAAIIATGVLYSALEPAQAAERKITLMLGGSYCDLYWGEVESAVKKVSGVKAVDFKSMKGHVIVTVEDDKTTAKQLEVAISGVKGEGWHCRAKEMK